MQIKFKQFQLIILMVSFASILINVGRLIANPDISKRQVSEYNFAEKILLPEWNFVKSLKSEEKIDYEVVIANRKYLYQKDNQILEIDNRYVIGTRGTYHGLMKIEDKLNQKKNETDFLLSIRAKNNLNYALFIKENKAHLVSCINATGGSTITTDEFIANRYENDLKLTRFIPWLKGEEASIDLRCLWSDLSIPINDNNSAELTYKNLENAWFSWYDYWHKNFPNY